MYLEKALTIIYYFLLFVFLLTVIIGLAGAAAACFRERKRKLAALDKTAACYPVSGVILDAQLIRDLPGTADPMHHKYSVRFTDVSGNTHRAFIGMSSFTPLVFSVGEAVELRIFQQSVIVPDTDAFNPNRGASGRIDCKISFRKWLDKPVDETGTVMLEKDYQDLSFELERSVKSQQTAGWLLLIGTALAVIVSAGTCIALLLEF